MVRMTWIGIFLFALSPAGAFASDEKASPQEQFSALAESFEKQMTEFQEGFAELKTDEERERHWMENMPEPEAVAGKMIALAKAHQSEVGFQVVEWVLSNRVEGEHRETAMEMLKEHHLGNEEVGSLLYGMAYDVDPTATAILESIAANGKSEKLRGVAHFALAKHLLGRCEMARYVAAASEEELEGMKGYFGEAGLASLKNLDAVQVTARAESLLDKVSTEFASVPAQRGGTLGDAAKRDLFEIRNLAIGKAAPEIEGEDIDGVTFKLSDYRGKVIFLDFWGDW